MGGGVSIGNCVPVDNVPESADIVRASILVVQVVGVFPDIETKNGSASFHQGAVLVGGAFHDQLISVNTQPRPTAAKPRGRGVGKGFLKCFEAAAGGINGCCEVPLRGSAGSRSHDAPEQRVVSVSATIVANCSANLLWDTFQVAHEVLYAFTFEIGTSDSGVNLVDIGLVMLTMVDFHRAGIDVWFQGVMRIGQVRKFVSHCFNLSSVSVKPVVG